MLVALMSLFVALSGGLSAGSAQAAFPGINGRIAFVTTETGQLRDLLG